jgi:hypothetical protein
MFIQIFTHVKFAENKDVDSEDVSFFAEFRSRPIGYLACAQMCPFEDVPIWGYDCISDWLNASPLMTCGASQCYVSSPETGSKQSLRMTIVQSI